MAQKMLPTGRVRQAARTARGGMSDAPRRHRRPYHASVTTTAIVKPTQAATCASPVPCVGGSSGSRVAAKQPVMSLLDGLCALGPAVHLNPVKSQSALLHDA